MAGFGHKIDSLAIAWHQVRKTSSTGARGRMAAITDGMFRGRGFLVSLGAVPSARQPSPTCCHVRGWRLGAFLRRGRLCVRTSRRPPQVLRLGGSRKPASAVGDRTASRGHGDWKWVSGMPAERKMRTGDKRRVGWGGNSQKRPTNGLHSCELAEHGFWGGKNQARTRTERRPSVSLRASLHEASLVLSWPESWTAQVAGQSPRRPA